MARQKSALLGVWHDLLDLVYPPLCVSCGEYSDSDQVICDRCMSRLELYDHPMCLGCFQLLPTGRACPACSEKQAILIACANYSGPLIEMIKQFKFHGVTSPARLMARLVAERFGREITSSEPQLLVPVPLHSSREYARGYNQAALFAARLSHAIDVPVAENIITRTGRRRPQSKLKAHQREDNIKGVFQLVSEPDSNTGRRIALVDDLVTSGATAREARRTLVDAGWEVPLVIAIGHGL